MRICKCFNSALPGMEGSTEVEARKGGVGAVVWGKWVRRGLVGLGIGNLQMSTISMVDPCTNAAGGHVKRGGVDLQVSCD